MNSLGKISLQIKPKQDAFSASVSASSLPLCAWLITKWVVAVIRCSLSYSSSLLKLKASVNRCTEIQQNSKGGGAFVSAAASECFFVCVCLAAAVQFVLVRSSRAARLHLAGSFLFQSDSEVLSGCWCGYERFRVTGLSEAWRRQTQRRKVLFFSPSCVLFEAMSVIDKKQQPRGLRRELPWVAAFFV